MKDEGNRSKEIDNVRRIEQGRGRKQPDSEAGQLRRRLERNVAALLEMDLDEFLRALEEDYQLNESQIAKAKESWRQNRGG
ncbi:MAG: hypothetical protein WBQ09_00895 [Terriglobales bacterium]|jgi:hypothetical protein